MPDAERQLSTRAWTGFVLLLCFGFFARGLALACIIPPLEMWDEYQHVGYIAFVDQYHRTPIFPADVVPELVVRQAVAFPQPPSALQQLAASGGTGYGPFWRAWPQRPAFNPSPRPPLYEAQHPPVYYRFAVPIWRLADGEHHLARAVAALRLTNLLLGTGALAVVLIFLGTACRDRRHAMLLGLWVALEPLLLLDVDRVANDALALLLGTAVVAWTLSLLTRGTRRWPWHAGGVGLLIGCAIVSKPTNVAIVPVLSACLLIALVRHKVAFRTAMLTIALASCCAAAVCIPLLIFNQRHYHLWLPLQQMLLRRDHPISVVDVFHFLRTSAFPLLPRLAYRWAVGDALWIGGWSFLRPWESVTTCYAVLLAAAVLGRPLGWIFRREPPSSRVFTSRSLAPALVVLGASFFAALTLHAVTAILTWGNDGTWPWYAEVATPWLLAGVGASSIGYRNSRLRYTLTMAVPLLFVGTEWLCTAFLMVPAYAQQPFGVTALKRLSMLQPAALGRATLAVAAAVAMATTVAAIWWCVAVFWPADWNVWSEDLETGKD